MPEIKTERLLLRNIVKSDARAIYEYSKNAKVGPDAGWAPHESLSDTKAVMKAMFLDNPNVFGIVSPYDDKIIGTVGLVTDLKREYEKAMMLGYALSEEYWGKGYMTEAAKAVIKYGFKTLKLNLISAYCYPYNEASKRIIKKCGFIYEGTLKMSEMRFDGVLLDDECYAITRDEYREEM